MPISLDIHAHVALPAYTRHLLDAGITLPGYAGGQPPPPPGAEATTGSPEDVARRLEQMDEAGVQRQVLSATVGPYLVDHDRAATAARLVNDLHAGLVAQHPQRFAAFAALPLPHLDQALVELERGLDELGMLGVAVHCSVLDRSVADEAFDPLFAELDRRGSVLFLHPAVNGACSPLVTEWGLSATAGTVFEDTLAALHLIIRRVPQRFPRVRIVVPHLGGALPMLLNRLDNQLPMSVPGLAEPPSRTARRFWYDTVGHGSAAALHAAVEAFGPDRLVAGSDYPVMLAFHRYGETFDQLRAAGLSDAELEGIFQTNADALFHVPAE